MRFCAYGDLLDVHHVKFLIYYVFFMIVMTACLLDHNH